MCCATSISQARHAVLTMKFNLAHAIALIGSVAYTLRVLSHDWQVAHFETYQSPLLRRRSSSGSNSFMSSSSSGRWGDLRRADGEAGI
jgi:hypothetical protein